MHVCVWLLIIGLCFLLLRDGMNHLKIIPITADLLALTLTHSNPVAVLSVTRRVLSLLVIGMYLLSEL
jgi:hypothetical protein